MMVNMQWYEMYIIIDIAFVLMSIFQLYLPAYAIAKEELSKEYIHISDYLGWKQRWTEAVAYSVVAVIVFPVLALVFILSPQGSTQGYARSIVKGVKKSHEKQRRGNEE